MAKVEAPNGDVYEVPDAVASGLVNSKNSGFKAVDEAKSEPKPAAKRTQSKK